MKSFFFVALLFLLCFSFAQAYGLPTPPPYAIVFNQIEQMSGWQSCHNPGCAGGSGSGSYWMAQWQRTPSLSGGSGELYNSGVWANALWWKKFGSHNGQTNLLWDFYVQLDSNAQYGAQSLEYDAFQFVGGFNYMIGSQCDIAAGVWDTWDEYGGHWHHTSIPCHRFPAGTWHHIQWYVTTNHTYHTYHYVELVVDGVAYYPNVTYSAKYLAWGDNIGVQYQLDVNGSGHGYHQWFDNSKLSIW